MYLPMFKFDKYTIITVTFIYIILVLYVIADIPSDAQPTIVELM